MFSSNWIAQNNKKSNLEIMKFNIMYKFSILKSVNKHEYRTYCIQHTIKGYQLFIGLMRLNNEFSIFTK